MQPETAAQHPEHQAISKRRAEFLDEIEDETALIASRAVHDSLRGRSVQERATPSRASAKRRQRASGLLDVAVQGLQLSNHLRCVLDQRISTNIGISAVTAHDLPARMALRTNASA